MTTINVTEHETIIQKNDTIIDDNIAHDDIAHDDKLHAVEDYDISLRFGILKYFMSILKNFFLHIYNVINLRKRNTK